MDQAQPDAVAKMKLLRAANLTLLRAERKELKARKRWTEAVDERALARRGLKAALDALQPELFDGEVPPILSTQELIEGQDR
jgi:hypothetical protein